MIGSFFPDEIDDDLSDVKNSKVAVNGTHRRQSGGSSSSSGGGGSEGSGLVAKVVFLVLLVALSTVVALILVELRGKKGRACRMTTNTVTT